MFEYSNQIKYMGCLNQIKAEKNNFVNEEKIQNLRNKLSNLVQNNEFILQIGPCSEELNIQKTKDFCKVIFSMKEQYDKKLVNALL